MRILARLDRVLEWCERVFHVLALSMLGIILIINVLNIASRALFDAGLAWVFPWSVVLFVWMTFVGFYVLYRQRRDITVVFLVERMPRAGRLAARLFVNAVILTVMGIMLWHAPQSLASQTGYIQMVGLGRYTLAVPLFVSCALIFVTIAIDVVEALLGRPERGAGDRADI